MLHGLIDHLDYSSIIICLHSERSLLYLLVFFFLNKFFCHFFFIHPSCFDSGISRKITSQRGFCKQCNSIVWLSNSKCSNECFGKISDEHQIMPVSIKQVCECYLLSTVRRKEMFLSLQIFLVQYNIVFSPS